MHQLQSALETASPEADGHVEPLREYLHEHPASLLAFLDVAERYSHSVAAGRDCAH